MPPMDTTATDAAATIVRNDLDYITKNLSAEFARMEGKRLLIVGGAGFLGYYLVQAALHWNRTAASPIDVTVYDNYIRGIPEWLSNLANTPNLTLVRHDISQPLPKDVPSFRYII